MYTQAQPFQVLHLKPGCSPGSPCQPGLGEEGESWSVTKFRISQKQTCAPLSQTCTWQIPCSWAHTHSPSRAWQVLLDLA